MVTQGDASIQYCALDMANRVLGCLGERHEILCRLQSGERSFTDGIVCLCPIAPFLRFADAITKGLEQLLGSVTVRINAALRSQSS
jgi:hypothetical protein